MMLEWCELTARRNIRKMPFLRRLSYRYAVFFLSFLVVFWLADRVYVSVFLPISNAPAKKYQLNDDLDLEFDSINQPLPRKHDRSVRSTYLDRGDFGYSHIDQRFQFNRDPVGDVDTNIDTKYWDAWVDNVAIVGTQGLRPQMEDRFRVMLGRTESSSDVYGVFDGHGGVLTAEMVESHLLPKVRESMARQKPTTPLSYTDLLTDDFRAVDKTVIDRVLLANDDSGSTAIVAIKNGKTLVVGNSGDSRGVLATHRGDAIAVSRDHKPNNIDEEARIRSKGGFVSMWGVWRVNGILATSRSFGDKFLKLPVEILTVDPEVRSFDLAANDAHFLILATDGLWDVVSNQEAVDYIRQHISLKTPYYGAFELVNMALRRGTLDNVTVLVVLF